MWASNFHLIQIYSSVTFSVWHTHFVFQLFTFFREDICCPQMANKLNCNLSKMFHQWNLNCGKNELLYINERCVYYLILHNYNSYQKEWKDLQVWCCSGCIDEHQNILTWYIRKLYIHYESNSDEYKRCIRTFIQSILDTGYNSNVKVTWIHIKSLIKNIRVIQYIMQPIK